MESGYRIRQASIDDSETICAHRRAMYVDIHSPAETVLDEMVVRFRPWLHAAMERNEYLAWFVTTETGEVVAGVGLWLMDWPPHVIGTAARRANIVNVYTAPAHRRRGLAQELMQAALAWCRAHGIDIVILHASPAGRPLYEALGFESTNEMRLLLPGTQ